MARLYLLNSPVLTAYGTWHYAPVPLQEARRLAAAGAVSAIGHEGAAHLLSHLLRQAVPVNRITATLEPGDQALVLRLLQRLPEGRVLNAEELQAQPWELGLLRYLGAP